MKHTLIKDSILFKVYSICLLFLFMNSMFPWYMWNNSINQITVILTLAVSVILHFCYVHIFSLSKIDFVFIVILILAMSWHIFCRGGMVGNTMCIFIWIILLMLDKEHKGVILSFITKWMSLLLLVSLITYVLYFVGLHINPEIIVWNGGQYIHANYYTFVIPSRLLEYYRFMGIFMEPGHMTMGVVPVIIANRFDLKNKYVLILFIAELFSFSLAAYITLFVAYFLLYFSLAKIKWIFFALLFGVIAIFCINQLEGGNEMLDHYLWSRLDLSDGDNARNNRISDSFQSVYNTIMEKDEKWTGAPYIDTEAYGANSGYKKFIVQEGIIGIILFSFLYGYYAFVYRKKEIWIFTLILFLLLYQNAYPFWYAVFLSYILGCKSICHINN